MAIQILLPFQYANLLAASQDGAVILMDEILWRCVGISVELSLWLEKLAIILCSNYFVYSAPSADKA